MLGLVTVWEPSLDLLIRGMRRAHVAGCFSATDLVNGMRANEMGHEASAMLKRRFKDST